MLSYTHTLRDGLDTRKNVIFIQLSVAPYGANVWHLHLNLNLK
jgi:hypothetical protein